MAGEHFSDFVNNNFPNLFENFQIIYPARSPDVNPTENLFILVRSKLNKDAVAMDITKEDFESFSARVKSTICNDPTDFIDKTIESMNKRMKLIAARKGHRTKY